MIDKILRITIDQGVCNADLLNFPISIDTYGKASSDSRGLIGRIVVRYIHL